MKCKSSSKETNSEKKTGIATTLFRFWVIRIIETMTKIKSIITAISHILGLNLEEEKE